MPNNPQGQQLRRLPKEGRSGHCEDWHKDAARRDVVLAALGSRDVMAVQSDSPNRRGHAWLTHMAKMPSTRPELLERIKGALKKPRSKWRLADIGAWREFEDQYREVLLRVGKRRGLNREDCEDLVQEVMIVVRKHLPEFVYDRSRGPFGGWLMKIVALEVCRYPSSPAEVVAPRTSSLVDGSRGDR